MYSRSNCSYNDQLRSWLDANKINSVEKDISQDPPFPGELHYLLSRAPRGISSLATISDTEAEPLKTAEDQVDWMTKHPGRLHTPILLNEMHILIGFESKELTSDDFLILESLFSPVNSDQYC
jgi:arsenate reductase-like glutaredoxin family protein